MTRKGFSLIELVVVVLLVGILAAFASHSYITSKQATQADSAKATLSAIAGAARAYSIRFHGKMPPSLGTLANPALPGGDFLSQLGPGLIGAGSSWNSGPYTFTLVGSGGIVAKAARNSNSSTQRFNVYTIYANGQCLDGVNAPCH